MPVSASIDGPSRRALALRDLTDPHAGPHALQQLVTDTHTALAQRWGCRRQLQRGTIIVAASDPAGIERQLTPELALRPRMRSLLPELLSAQALDLPEDLLLVCPGMVYRRSPISPLHSSEPHQLDLWRLRRGRLGTIELAEMLRTVLSTLLPGRHYRLLPAARPHLSHGMRIDLHTSHGWLAIGRAGLLAPPLLAAAGLDPAGLSAIGMTLGLDRVLMQRKGIHHIQLLRSQLPAIATQMLDLGPFQLPVDAPLQIRDIALPSATRSSAEQLADHIRILLPEQLDMIEAVELLAGNRLRLSLRHPCRQLSGRDADAIAAAVGDLLAQPATEPRAAYA